MESVLIVDTDEQRLRARADQLLMDDYEVQVAQAARQARVKLAEKPDAVVLCDAGSGPETMRLLRELRAGEMRDADVGAPVLALGADDDSSAVRLYRTGADVVLPALSSPLLVAAGLEALARRADGTQQRSVVRVGNLKVDSRARSVEVASKPVKLTRREFDLLRALISRPQDTLTRRELTRDVWGFAPELAGPRIVDAQAYRVKRKLEQAGAGPRVEVVRGVGWRLQP